MSSAGTGAATRHKDASGGSIAGKKKDAVS